MPKINQCAGQFYRPEINSMVYVSLKTINVLTCYFYIQQKKYLIYAIEIFRQYVGNSGPC
jgi:hypothetical protein